MARKGPDYNCSMNPSLRATLLGGLTAEQFLAEYWQKKPLLVRQAIPGFGDMIDRQGLLDLACRDDAECRLVRQSRGRWQVEYGPQTPEALQLDMKVQVKFEKQTDDISLPLFEPAKG